MRTPVAAIVEDDLSTAEIIAEMCRQHGYQSNIYKSGVDAIFGLHERRPDILIVDIHMPNIGGDTLLEHLVSPPYSFREVPIAMFTADKSYNAKAQHAGLTIRVFFKDGGVAELGRYLEALKPKASSVCSL